MSGVFVSGKIPFVMRVQVQTQPGGFALPIPADYAAALHLSATSEVELTLLDGKLTVAPPLQLADLLAGILPSNLHGEVATDGAQGTELW